MGEASAHRAAPALEVPVAHGTHGAELRLLRYAAAALARLAAMLVAALCVVADRTSRVRGR